ncbi:hydroxyethylthiazole kinase [Levilactobacillus bambusae]|uniref:Hydroxyethylthiazole kinase n=1 Tax=Levilactobacillus bambusae TaxID=2024736 RepID=A0A2V1MY71_9LACO|nr:hydroxyethylthiazole kinase [Levilactobacillus bambusae]PWF99771.1 hydroxyethylthiazole kinase [Levilactobacillus bambusae]
MKIELLEELREQNPVIFNISNFVTVQDVANGINAIGASPIMSEEVLEAEEMVKMAGAVCLNFGAFTQPQINQIRTVGKLANEFHKPLILDPVAVGAVKFRQETIFGLLSDFHPDIIRGNAGEIAALAELEWNAKGIDAGDGTGDLTEIAVACARKWHCIVMLSGTIDYVTDGQTVVRIENGTPLFQLHVGSGDMVSSIVAAFAAVSADNLFEAAQTGGLVFAATGELVANHLLDEDADHLRPGTFAVELMDMLHNVTVADVEAVAEFD